MIERGPAPPRRGANIPRRVRFLLPLAMAMTRCAPPAVGLTLALGSLLAVAPSDGLAQEPPPAFSMRATPQPLPAIEFENGQGEPMRLTDFRGKVVLLNIWATWCAPCRREMPTLDRLQAELGGPDFEVVALSIDRSGLPVVKEFYDELGLRELGMYVDTSAKASRELNALGVPTTLLIDREGNELGRLLGPAEWDTPEMMDFIRDQIQEPSGASVRPAAYEQLASNEVRRPVARLSGTLPSSNWKQPPHAQQGEMA